MSFLNTKEHCFYNKFQKLKNVSGQHSPSIFDLKNNFPEININIDACFLSNPYAFDHCYKYINKFDLKDLIKYYPPQNNEVARHIAKFRNIKPQNILIGNGAMEIIEKCIKSIYGKKIVIPIPTFSTYYELASHNNDVYFYSLAKNKNFQINIHEFEKYVDSIKADYIFLVNPSNPSGAHINIEDLKYFHSNLSNKQTLIIDESFIDFATDGYTLEASVENHKNLIVIRSLSKDLGIAGLRLGYGVFPSALKENFMKMGFLWNSNGIAYKFAEVLNDPEFTLCYSKIKKKYKHIRDDFYLLLRDIPFIKVYPSEANFFLIETFFDSRNLFIGLLVNHGIYVRNFYNRIGLKGNFLRIACRTQEENLIIAKAITYEISKIIKSVEHIKYFNDR